jgi:hypothetical protein
MAFKKSEIPTPAKTARSAGLCEWNNYGDSCQHRGILSPGTSGGPWYCREHFYRLRGYKDMEDEGLHGNQLPTKPMHSYAVEQLRPLVTRTGGSMGKFLRKREPGQDDEEAA